VVTHYSFIFINEKAKSAWTEQFIESKRIAEGMLMCLFSFMVFIYAV